MAYRDDRNALETRRAALEGELSAIEARKRELTDLSGRQEELARELEKTRALLRGIRGDDTRAPSLLDNVRIASPCSAKWDEMSGDERARFCGQCAKNVYNLSDMSRDDAEDFLRTRTGEICVRLYRRADGTVITSDCPVGVRRKRRRHLAVIAVGGGAIAASVMSRYTVVPVMGEMPRPSMGDVAVQGELMPPPLMGSVAAPSPPPPEEHRVAAPPPHRTPHKVPRVK